MKRGHTAWRLDEQMYNRIRLLSGFYLGTLSIIGRFCRLARGNSHVPGILGLYGKSKIRRLNFCQILSPKIVEYEHQTR